MKTHSSRLAGKFWLAAVTVAWFLLPVAAAAQAGNIGRDRIGSINRGRVGVVTTVEPGKTPDLNAKLKIRSGGFFLGNTALLKAGRGNRVIPSSPAFAPVVLGTDNGGDYLVFKAGGAERATISADGNFGIGTTSPGAKLHLDATGAATARLGAGVTTNDYGRLEFYGKASANAVTIGYLPFINTRSGSAATVAAIEVGKEGEGADNNSFMTFSTSGGGGYGERMRVTSAGNVGIGTTSPGAKLHLDATGAATARLGAGVTTNDYGRLEFYGKASANAVTIGYLPFINTRSGSAATVAAIEVGKEGEGADNNSFMTFSTSGGGGYGEQMRVTSAGNVGIGTTSPQAIFNVSTSSGAITNFDSSNSTGAYSAFYDTVGTRTVRGFVGFGPTLFGTGDNTLFGLRSQGALTFGTNGGTRQMSIDTSGNVGIGTTSPAQKLSVNGDALLGTQLYFNGGNQMNFGYATNGVYTGYINYSGYQNSDTQYRNLYIGDGRQSNILASFIGATGNVGIGTTTPTSGYKLDVNGDARVGGNINLTGTINAKYQDVAEWVPSSEQLAAGTVVVLDSTKSNQVTSSSVSYDTRVAGVISAQPGLALGEKSDNKVLVATTGRVKVKVDASKGPIHIGDLLVTSDIPGVAMKSEPVEFAGRKMHMPGTLIGKALEPLEKGKGEILVLLSLQ